MKKILTLCMVIKDQKILLGMKKRGFGEGRWNGFGGKLEKGEAIEDGVVRELKEETGIQAIEIKKIGLLNFSFESIPEILEVHVFKTTNFIGEPQESEEMKPEWFIFDEIPFEKMWSDDKYWFPFLLQNKLFKGNFHFDRPSDAKYSAKIISHTIEEVKK